MCDSHSTGGNLIEKPRIDSIHSLPTAGRFTAASRRLFKLAQNCFLSLFPLADGLRCFDGSQLQVDTYSDGGTASNRVTVETACTDEDRKFRNFLKPARFLYSCFVKLNFTVRVPPGAFPLWLPSPPLALPPPDPPPLITISLV